MTRPEFYAGSEHRAPYPFVRTAWEAPPEDPYEEGGAPNMQPTWKPGVEHDNIDQYHTVTFADRMGEVVFTVIGAFKPGSYPTRIFYVRQWVDPDGKQFGSTKLRVTTQQHFRQLIKGYRHDFEMSDYEDAKAA